MKKYLIEATSYIFVDDYNEGEMENANSVTLGIYYKCLFLNTFWRFFI